MNIIKNLSIKYKFLLIFSLMALLSGAGIYVYSAIALGNLVEDVVPTQQIVGEFGNLTRGVQIELLDYLRTGEEQTAAQFTETASELLALAETLNDYADDPGEATILAENVATSRALIGAGEGLIENHGNTLEMLEKFGELDAAKDEARASIVNLLLPEESALTIELVTRVADRTDYLQAETLEFVISGEDTTREGIENVRTALGLELNALTDLLAAEESLPANLKSYADISADIATLSNRIVANHTQTQVQLDQLELLQGRLEENGIALVNVLEEDITSNQQQASRIAWGLAIAFQVIALLLGLLMVRGIVERILELKIAARKLGDGDLSVRVSSNSRDEIGNLMYRYNLLADYVDQMVTDLRQQAQAIATSSEVSRRLSTILDPAELTTAVVELLQVSFKFYHAHIYLYDKEREYLVMAGGTGEAGRAMLDNGHKIESGKGLVGRTAENNKPTLVPDVTADPNWLPNPLLPETKAEVAVPITLENEVLGVLDIQHNITGSLDEADVNLLAAIANQVAIGLRNARQYKQLQASEARTKNVLDAINIPIAISRISDGSFRYFNRPSIRAIGMDPDNLRDVKAESFNAGGMSGHQELVALLREQGRVDNLEMTLRKITGEPMQVVMSARILDYRGERSIMTSYIDVTEHYKAREASLKRVKEMETVAELGTVSATILDPDRLLQEMVDLIKARFELYHAHIHLLNDRQDTMVLTAGAGEIGQKMVAEGRRIPLAAEGSLVATVARTKQGDIRNYDPPGEGFMPHPLLSETSCEMAVPISVGEEVLGVLDVRSDQFNYFTKEDMQTYTVMAGQIAVALENARSHRRSEQAIQELQELSRRLTREGWDEFFEQQLDELAFRYDLEKVETVMEAAGEDAASETETEAMLVQPLQVQGESIGELLLDKSNVSEDEASEIVSAVAERLGAHLENLRLARQTQGALNETQRRTEELAILNEMSQSLTAQTSVDGVFQTVYDYLSRLMDTTNFFTGTYDEESDEVAFVLTASGNELNWYTEKRQAGQGVTEYLIRQRQPLLIPDKVGERLAALGIEEAYDNSPESWLGAPITLGDRVLGVIGLESYSSPHLYNEQHLNLLTAVANQAAIAIESTRLLEGSVALAEEEQILRQITTRVSTAIDAESILRTAAEEIGRALGLEGYVSLEAVGTNGKNGRKPTAKSLEKADAS